MCPSRVRRVSPVSRSHSRKRVVSRAGEGAAAVGQHRHRADRSGVPFEGAQGLAGFEIPQPQGAVGGAGEGAAAVGQHRHRVTQSVCPSRVRRVSPVSRSHNRSVLSLEPERARRPSASTATALTQLVCPSRVRRVSPVSRSHSRKVLSSEPERARRAVAQHRHRADPSRCALRGCAGVSPVSRSHSRSVWSAEPERARRAVGQHRHRADPIGVPFEGAQGLRRFRDPTAARCCHRSRRGRGGRRPAPPPRDHLVCPSRVRRVSPVARSHSRNVPSPEPERARRPSASTATALTQTVCPSRVRRVSPVARSHSRNVSSQEPERARRPSGRTQRRRRIPMPDEDLAQRSAGRGQRGKSRTQPRPVAALLRSRARSR